MRTKSGQVTIFVIVGIVIVATVLLFLLLRGGSEDPVTGGTSEANTESFLETCLKDVVREGTERIGAQGGYINPGASGAPFIAFKFQNETPEDISYLCYTRNFYSKCVVQRTALLSHITEQLKEYIEDDVYDCFDQLTDSLEQEGYAIEVREGGFEVELIPEKILINFKKQLTLTKQDKVSRKTDIQAVIPSNFYGLGKVAQEIVRQESTFCSFNELGYMAPHPELWSIYPFTTGDATTIYIIKHQKTNEMFQFAIKRCVV